MAVGDSLDIDTLIAMFPNSVQAICADVAQRWNTDLGSFGILDKEVRLKNFFAQVATESGGLSIVEENLNYSAQRLTQVFPSRFPTLAAATPYANNPQQLANFVYSNPSLNPNPGDGWLYRGRGLIQLTWRVNYRDIGAIAGLDIETNPDLAMDPMHVLRLAGAYWQHANCNALCDAPTQDAVMQAVTKAVKGSTQEIDQRTAWFTKIDKTLSWPLSPPDPDNIELPLNHNQLIDVQEALRDKGYYKGGIDGLFFTGSRQSLKAFQTAKGLKPTGWLTAASLQALGVS